MQLLLQGRGFDVKAYGSAEALLADPDMENAACLVADYRLGELNGIAVLETLRDRGWIGPAMLITAFGSAELAARAKTAGFDEVFDKPFKDHAFVTALERVTTQRPNHD
jgi:FixJ family two-component response regulator